MSVEPQSIPPLSFIYSPRWRREVARDTHPAETVAAATPPRAPAAPTAKLASAPFAQGPTREDAKISSQSQRPAAQTGRCHQSNPRQPSATWINSTSLNIFCAARMREWLSDEQLVIWINQGSSILIYLVLKHPAFWLIRDETEWLLKEWMKYIFSRGYNVGNWHGFWGRLMATANLVIPFCWWTLFPLDTI